MLFSDHPFRIAMAMIRRWIEYLRELARVKRFRLLRRYHRRGGERALWKFTRDSVARGVAVGFFFGVLTPVAQVVFAIIVAAAVRANVLVAAASTFITNPFVMPFIYYFAYGIGSSITERRRELAADLVISEEAAEHALDVADWVSTLSDWATSIALPFVLGVVSLALIAALVGFLLTHAAWGLVTRLGRSGAQ